MANDKISNMTAAVVGDLGATTSGLECTVDLGGAPTTKQVPLGVLADWLEASQLAALIVTNSVVSATAIATPGAFGATRGAFFASTVSGAALMGFGTTNDVALMNRAGTVCLGVGPNTTTINIPGTLTVTGLISANGGLVIAGGGGAYSAGKLSSDATFGLVMQSITGTTDDWALFTPAGAYIAHVPTGTTTFTITNAATVGSTLAVTGTTTATGGLLLATQPTIYAAAGGLWQLATAGTDTACTNGTSYFVELNIPYNQTLTGVAYQVGSVGGTDSVIVTLYNSAGTVVANSALAGATVGTAAQIQSVAFTGTYAAVAGRYFASVTFNGATAKFRTYPIPGSKFIAGSEAETFGTVTAITPGTSFTADKGPLCYVY